MTEDMYFHLAELFSDEDHFCLNRYVNKQNGWIWSEENVHNMNVISFQLLFGSIKMALLEEQFGEKLFPEIVVWIIQHLIWRPVSSFLGLREVGGPGLSIQEQLFLSLWPKRVINWTLIEYAIVMMNIFNHQSINQSKAPIELLHTVLQMIHHHDILILISLLTFATLFCFSIFFLICLYYKMFFLFVLE